ncbi:hypothetical protein RRG08_008316 [Elysia crispata]|uniref:Uncharacterized protein n=1 Tax=Elysia crispata TaxID=231223 RepID=A0AAE1DIL3_9GAST|nr:hypothetical protein RRG08_008316 [Elysia crispata]
MIFCFASQEIYDACVHEVQIRPWLMTSLISTVQPPSVHWFHDIRMTRGRIAHPLPSSAVCGMPYRRSQLVCNQREYRNLIIRILSDGKSPPWTGQKYRKSMTQPSVSRSSIRWRVVHAESTCTILYRLTNDLQNISQTSRKVGQMAPSRLSLASEFFGSTYDAKRSAGSNRRGFKTKSVQRLNSWYWPFLSPEITKRSGTNCARTPRTCSTALGCQISRLTTEVKGCGRRTVRAASPGPTARNWPLRSAVGEPDITVLLIYPTESKGEITLATLKVAESEPAWNIGEQGHTNLFSHCHHPPRTNLLKIQLTLFHKGIQDASWTNTSHPWLGLMDRARVRSLGGLYWIDCSSPTPLSQRLASPMDKSCSSPAEPPYQIFNNWQ